MIRRSELQTTEYEINHDMAVSLAGSPVAVDLCETLYAARGNYKEHGSWGRQTQDDRMVLDFPARVLHSSSRIGPEDGLPGGSTPHLRARVSGNHDRRQCHVASTRLSKLKVLGIHQLKARLWHSGILGRDCLTARKGWQAGRLDGE